jgi:serine/threonine protein kinase/Tol biopolymer transport system component
MALNRGSRLGAYEVTGSLGAGGMGEVYRAHDSKLGRDVAIKVLPDSFASDPDRLARLTREARVLASLNHPNIAHVYGIEESNGVGALVMELVEGQTLADLISSSCSGGRRIPVDEVLTIAKQIADGLEAAHDQGIVHRDLKPANVKVRPDGTVKVLDFGLAKAVDSTPRSSASAMLSPTISVHGTQAGLILGTAAYMSPEQARGKSADRRSDIWSFGAVLFETLAGRHPFDGGDVSDVLASILKSEPAWDGLPVETPAAVKRLLRRCLQKEPRRRLQHIGDARIEIEEAQRAEVIETVHPSTRVVWPERLAWLAALAVTGGLAGVAIAHRNASGPPELRVEISTPTGARPGSFAISPDDRLIVFSADGAGGPQLWVRPLNSTSARALAGTDGAIYPFWSPDARSIGFFTNNKLKRVDIEDGQVRPLATVITPAGGTWGPGGTILFVPSDNGGVFRISENGGPATAETPRRSPQLATRWPQLLPDGHHYLFYVARGAEPAGVYVGEVGTADIRKVLDNDWPAMYGAGRLWFARDTSLYSQSFSLSSRQASGPITRVADDVGRGLHASMFFVSPTGSLAYRTPVSLARRLTWFDRSGKQLDVVGEEGKTMSNPTLSPDGRFVVVQRTVKDNIDLWSVDLTRKGDFTRLTFDPGIQAMPLWSPDGKRLAFNTIINDASVIAIKRIDAMVPDEVLSLQGAGPRIVCDWSPDGRYILYKQFDDQTGTMDLWAVPLEGDRAPIAVARTPFDDRDGQFSPDGKWVAYDSDESGRPAIYVQPFPQSGAKRLVSTAGGSQPRWRSDGQELFYVAPDGYLMAVRWGRPRDLRGSA